MLIDELDLPDEIVCNNDNACFDHVESKLNNDGMKKRHRKN